jgi:hypothetical protein
MRAGPLSCRVPYLGSCPGMNPGKHLGSRPGVYLFPAGTAGDIIAGVAASLAIDDGERARGASMRVLVVAEPSLFEEGVEELLRQEPGFEILGRETDSLEIVRLIQEDSLDVLVVIDGQGATGLVRELIRMVQNGFRIRVVEVNRANNTLCHYCGEQEAVRDGRALLDAVRGICHSSMRDAQAPLARVMVPPIA